MRLKFISSASDEMHLYRVCREKMGTIGTVECEFNQAFLNLLNMQNLYKKIRKRGDSKHTI